MGVDPQYMWGQARSGQPAGRIGHWRSARAGVPLFAGTGAGAGAAPLGRMCTGSLARLFMYNNKHNLFSLCFLMILFICSFFKFVLMCILYVQFDILLLFPVASY